MKNLIKDKFNRISDIKISEKRKVERIKFTEKKFLEDYFLSIENITNFEKLQFYFTHLKIGKRRSRKLASGMGSITGIAILKSDGLGVKKGDLDFRDPNLNFYLVPSEEFIKLIKSFANYIFNKNFSKNQLYELFTLKKLIMEKKYYINSLVKSFENKKIQITEHKTEVKKKSKFIKEFKFSDFKFSLILQKLIISYISSNPYDTRIYVRLFSQKDLIPLELLFKNNLIDILYYKKIKNSSKDTQKVQYSSGFKTNGTNSKKYQKWQIYAEISSKIKSTVGKDEDP